MLLLAMALAAAQTPVEPPAKVDLTTRQKKVCRTSTSDAGVSTGTIMGPARVCRTAEQWAKVDAKARAKAD